MLNEDISFEFYSASSANGRGSVNANGTGSVCGNGVNASKKYKGQSSTLQNFSNKKECQRHSC